MFLCRNMGNYPKTIPVANAVWGGGGGGIEDNSKVIALISH